MNQEYLTAMDAQTRYNSLSDLELDKLAAISTACQYADGELIFSEGDEADSMYIGSNRGFRCGRRSSNPARW